MKKIYIAAAIVFLAFVGLAWALVPPPPANQNIGIYDTGIATYNEPLCRNCHDSTSLGGVPTRHHNLVPTGEYGCTTCHPVVTGPNGQSVLIDRNCINCHNGTAFYANPTALNISRPHHINTVAAQTRQCSDCHGGFIADYDDGHYVPSYNTSIVTPYADNRVYNATSGRYWGGCLACHQNSSTTSPIVLNNHDNHHGEILGNSGGIGHQRDQTSGAACNWCHVINAAVSPTSVLRINGTGAWGLGCCGPLNNGSSGARLLEFRNSSVDALNGTACEKCHSVLSIHNIQFNYSGTNGQQGYGHIGANWDCNGCHAFWNAGEVPPFGGPIVIDASSFAPSVLTANQATVVTITGDNFVQDTYTTTVNVDGNSITPTSVTNSQIVVNVPALAAGVHQIQVVKTGATDSTSSKLSALTVVSPVTISSAKLRKGVITITGTGFGTEPAQDANQYVTIAKSDGTIFYSDSITSWSTTTIKAKKTTTPAAAVGDTVTVTTPTGSASKVITRG